MAGVMLVTPGTDDAPVKSACRRDGGGGDGCSGAGGRIRGGRRTEAAAAGFLARVNALGETLFAVATEIAA